MFVKRGDREMGSPGRSAARTARLAFKTTGGQLRGTCRLSRSAAAKNIGALNIVLLLDTREPRTTPSPPDLPVTFR